ncbi:hypothetical protein [Rhodococcus sp. RCBS9]|uniref:hypothetical protein n=1 Tax=Rhodococcus sp. RCBS9 TaxID=3031999 RepID=UPI002402C6CE|nr:hypothetical protein [Rhodococcus sp. RCBS9]WEX03789.1 hypothetical protein P0M12_29995 [Rhodococcus sp. RCBS9]
MPLEYCTARVHLTTDAANDIPDGAPGAEVGRATIPTLDEIPNNSVGLAQLSPDVREIVESVATKIDQTAGDSRYAPAEGSPVYSLKNVIDAEEYRLAGDLYDHQRVQRAVTAAANLGVREVLLKKAKYTFRQGINMNGCHDLTIRGAGPFSTEIYIPGTPADATVYSGFWTSGDCSGLLFDDFTIRGTAVDDVTGPRRARTYSPTPGVSQAFTFRGDLIPTSEGVTPNPAYPVVRDIEIGPGIRVKGTRTLPWLFAGVRGKATARGAYVENTMDASWIFCEIVEAHNLTSINSADNAFSFSRGNKCVNFSNLTAINPAYYAVWISGFRTSNPGADGPSWAGPHGVTGSGVIGRNCGMGGLLLDDAPRNGTVTGVMIDGVRRGPSDEPSALGGVGIRFGGFPSNDRVSPSEYASNFSVSDFVLIDCAKGGVQPTGSMDCSVHDGKIINCGSEFTEDGSTVISSSDTAQNFGIGTAGIEAGTVVRFGVYNVKVVDTRSTPRTNYPLYLEGTVNSEWFNVTGHGTRRTAATDRVATERRLLGSTIFESMLTLPSGLRSGATGAVGTVRGLDVNGAPGSRRQIGQALTGGVSRWEVAVTGDAEAGSNAGSNYVVAGYADSGTKLADYLTIRRSDGRASFGGAAQLKSYSTAGRPSASTSGAGASIYDTTLGKPVWSDGSGWKDASGTVV